MSTLIEASGKRVMRPDGHIHRRPHASAMLINSMQEASKVPNTSMRVFVAYGHRMGGVFQSLERGAVQLPI